VSNRLCDKCTTRLKDTHSKFCWCCNRERLAKTEAEIKALREALNELNGVAWGIRDNTSQDHILERAELMIGISDKILIKKDEAKSE